MRTFFTVVSTGGLATLFDSLLLPGRGEIQTLVMTIWWTLYSYVNTPHPFTPEEAQRFGKAARHFFASLVKPPRTPDVDLPRETSHPYAHWKRFLPSGAYDQIQPMFGWEWVTPYIHAFCCHVPQMLVNPVLRGSLHAFTMQSLEKMNNLHGQTFCQATDHKNGGIKPLMARN